MNLIIVFHIVFVLVAFAFTTGIGIFLSALAGSRDVRTIRIAAKTAQPLQMAGAILLVVGSIVGLVAAWRIGFNLTSPWLVGAYVLVALVLAIGLGIHRPWLLRVAKAAAASPDDQASAELNGMIDDRLVRIAGPVSGLVWVAIVVLMVFKP